ncbi:hypothetical protein GKZ28_09595 [Clostridium chromiireducens]|uniref:Uncharacterized protein n=1 Tax=Clostridium chromiireducens TaxID=225345 RepID=A0A964RM38_9CLOT|nr:hypothetical protein [Clostridium chromiireducens]MVX63945.1 hypothetical protein [Clostridium chromiireducens]
MSEKAETFAIDTVKADIEGIVTRIRLLTAEKDAIYVLERNQVFAYSSLMLYHRM